MPLALFSPRVTALEVLWIDAARIHAKVVEREPFWNGALRIIWLGPTDADGYGVLSVEGQRYMAHRVGYTMAHPVSSLNAQYFTRKSHGTRPGGIGCSVLAVRELGSLMRALLR